MHFLRRNRPGDCAARCKKTNDNLRNSKSFDLNGCDPQNLRLCPDAKQGAERGCSFDSFESWNWTKSKPFCRHNFPTNKVNPFYSFVLLKFYLFSSQTSWPTEYNIAYHSNVIMILSYIISSCIFTHHCWKMNGGIVNVTFRHWCPFFCKDTTHLGKKLSNLYINLVVTWRRISWS